MKKTFTTPNKISLLNFLVNKLPFDIQKNIFENKIFEDLFMESAQIDIDNITHNQYPIFEIDEKHYLIKANYDENSNSFKSFLDFIKTQLKLEIVVDTLDIDAPFYVVNEFLEKSESERTDFMLKIEQTKMTNFILETFIIVNKEFGDDYLNEISERKLARINESAFTAVTFPKYFGTHRIFALFESEPLPQNLKSGNTTRFFNHKFEILNEDFVYLNNQWENRVDAKNPKFSSFCDFIYDYSGGKYFVTFHNNGISSSFRLFENLAKTFPRQIIFFGSPGTGKSTEVKKRTQDKNITRTTFHPETDYQNFVGCYKPAMDGDKIRYEFVPQAFTDAYCTAWLTPTQNHYLIIEEINRGNCAQIFGDIFQCLDRNAQGFSEYSVNCSKELATHLQKELEKNPVAQANYLAHCGGYNKIVLPNNLYIFATMNTSDQSLFPMDSAFKRRWDWEYVPINYKEAANLTINIDENNTYNWGDFISIINPKIKELTGSEDKQLGNYFISPADKIISFEQFRSKVMFYLWSEMYKDEVGSQNSIFKYVFGENVPKDFQFGELFSDTKEGITPTQLVAGFMQFNGITNEVLGKKYTSTDYKK